MSLKTMFISTSHDNEQDRKARFFQNLVLSMVSVLILTLLVDCVIMPDFIFRWSIVIGIIFLTALFLLFINRKGFHKSASILLITIFMLIIFVLPIVLDFVYSSGDVKIEEPFSMNDLWEDL